MIVEPVIQEPIAGRLPIEPIRVGFVMHVMQVAGAEILVQRIIRQLHDRIAPVIFCLDRIGPIGEELQESGIPVLCLNRSPGIDLSVGAKLSQAARKYGTEILHAHQYTPFFYSALARIRGANTKLLFTEHGRHFPDSVSTRRRLANQWLLQRFADATNACCEFSAEALRSKEGFSSVSVIHNGINAEEFSGRISHSERSSLKESLGLDPNHLHVACIARFHPVKNHQLLLSAWPQIQNENPKARLLLIGDGECRLEMERLADQLGILGSVHFLGVRKNIDEFLQATDVFALTSKSEASSLTLLEAMASECAIVLTNVGGNAEHIRSGTEGLLVRPNDTSDLAKAILRLLNSPADRARLGQAAGQRARSDFQLDKVVDQYFDLYQKLTR